MVSRLASMGSGLMCVCDKQVAGVYANGWRVYSVVKKKHERNPMT